MRIKECLLVILLIKMASVIESLECFRNAADFNTEVQYCQPEQFPYCLKANGFDGNIYRNCATNEQCPQGQACAHITYEEDQTTDYVCCCSTPLCNSALFSKSSFVLVTMCALMFIFTVGNL